MGWSRYLVTRGLGIHSNSFAEIPQLLEDILSGPEGDSVSESPWEEGLRGRGREFAGQRETPNFYFLHGAKVHKMCATPLEVSLQMHEFSIHLEESKVVPCVMDAASRDQRPSHDITHH